MAQKRRFTVYDVMDARGDFDNNPANTSCQSYKKQEYPRMMYHPQGEERVTDPGEIIVTPMGPKEVGKKTEIINRVVGSADEEAFWKTQGWHLHPAKALKAAGKEAPATSSQERIDQLEAEIARLQDERLEVSA